MAPDIVLKLAKELGFDTAEKKPDWNGYEVFEPCYSDGGEYFTGDPLVILYQNGAARYSTIEEAYAYLNYLDNGCVENPPENTQK